MRLKQKRRMDAASTTLPDSVSRFSRFRSARMFGRVLITQIPILLQGLVNDPFEFNRNFRIQAHGSRRRLTQNGVKNVARAFAPERHRARHHFVEHRSE